MPRWQALQQFEPRPWQCGYCGWNVSSDQGYAEADHKWRIRMCPNCQKPSFFDEIGAHPAPVFGNPVSGISSEELDALYNEARNCTGANAYTGTVLLCRKLLMNIAVAQGAEAGLSFMKYVEFLADKGYVPPHGKDWVDHIRKKGNEANHEIVLMTQQDAADLLTFVEMLLKFIYEFPSRVKIASKGTKNVST